jgi:hypothetical protein
MRRPKSPSEPPSVTAATEPIEQPRQPRAQEQLTIVSSGEGYVFGYWGNVVIEVWGTRADVKLMTEIEKLMDTVSRAHSAISVVSLVVGQIPLPTPDARASMQRMTARYAKQTLGTAILLEHTGFWASAVLGFVTSLQSLQSKHMRIKTFSSLDELVPWVVTSHNAESAHTIDSGDLRRVLHSALAQLNQLSTRA